MSCYDSPYSNISSESGLESDRCQVCGATENVISRSDGTLFCRACWAFYRRSITQSRQYTCTRDNNCVIDQDGMRNVCRACRFKKCIEVGMQAEQDSSNHNDSIQISKDHKNNGNTNLSSTITQITNSANHHYPILNRILRDFESILSTQKSIFVADSPAGYAINFTQFEPRPLKKLSCGRIIDGTSRLVKMMFSKAHDIYGDVNLEGDTWNHSMAPFFEKFKILFKFFLTTKFGGTFGDEIRVFVHFGYYFDLNHLEWFLEDIPLTPDKMEQKIAVVRPVLTALEDTARRMRALEIRNVEFAALGAIQFWEHVDKNHLNNNSTLMCKEALYAEFHSNLIETYGLVKAGIRLIDLMAFIPEIMMFESNFNEMLIISKIFLDEPSVCGCECGN